MDQRPKRPYLSRVSESVIAGTGSTAHPKPDLWASDKSRSVSEEYAVIRHVTVSCTNQRK